MPASNRRYKPLSKYILRQWPSLLLILLLTGISSAASALQPWPLKLLVDYALGNEAVPEAVRQSLEALSVGITPVVLIVVAACSSLGLFVLQSALDVILSWSWTSAGQRMVFDLAADIFHRLQRFSFLFHVRQGIGESLSRLSGDTYCVYSLAHGLLVGPAHQILVMGSMGVVAWKLEPTLTAVTLITVPALAASAMFFGERLQRTSRVTREAETRLMGFVHQTLSAIPIVQAFGTRLLNRRTFQRLAADTTAATKRGSLFKDVYGMVNGLALTVGTALVLFLGGRRVMADAMSVGDLLVFLAYLRSWHEATQELLRTYGELRSVRASMDRVMEILETPEEVREMPGAKPLMPHRPHTGRYVCLEGVTFGYEPGRPVLKSLSMEARPGEMVAIVGPSGAGKSTLASLIPRFFDPWEGRVSMDGQDIRELKLSSVRSQVALVLQEPFLMPITVAENIAYGKPGATIRQIEEAARMAGAHEFILRLPRGYETVLSERGANLSGGERKRLAIARAILKDAPVLVLDEPTSAVDARTEAEIMEALEKLMQGRTTIVIAHRLSTIRRAHRIVVLKEGRVVEIGTHQELLGKGGLYAQLHTRQLLLIPQEGVA